MLAPRGSYLNVYYRGGSILKLQTVPTLHGSIDKKYLRSGQLPSQFNIREEADAASWVERVPLYKAEMDRLFAHAGKAEREFQQLVAWENNRSPIANETEYFITDIEFADSELGARFDMLGVRWGAGDRKHGRAIAPVLIEMKYGEKALGNASGMIEHLEHLSQYLEKKADAVQQIVEKQFNQLRRLGLIDSHQSNQQKVTQRPEVIFLLANTNPRSSQLRSVLQKLRTKDIRQDHFDLRFFAAGFAGYGMHRANMLTIDEFEGYLAALADRVRG